jgi:hypothetical protein
MPNYKTVGMIISEESLPTISESEYGIKEELELPSNTYVSLKKLAETEDQNLLDKQRKRFAADSRNLQFLENTPQTARDLCKGSGQGKIAESEVDPFLEFGASNEKMKHAAYGLHQQVGNNAFYSLPSLFQAQKREPKLSLSTAFCKIYDKENSIDMVEGPPKKIVKPYSGTIYNLAIENNPSEVMYLDTENQLQKCKVQDLATLIKEGKCLPIITVNANAEIKEPTAPNSDPEISVSYEYKYDADLLNCKWPENVVAEENATKIMAKELYVKLDDMKTVLNQSLNDSKVSDNSTIKQEISTYIQIIDSKMDLINSTYILNPCKAPDTLNDCANSVIRAGEQLKQVLKEETPGPILQTLINFGNWVKKKLNLDVKSELTRKDIKPVLALGSTYETSKTKNDLRSQIDTLKKRATAAKTAQSADRTPLPEKTKPPKP